MNCVRLLFCFYNLVFLIIGSIILGIGIWFAVDIQAEGILRELLKPVDSSDTTNNIVELVRQASYVLIAFGGFIFLISFLGYCGSIKESQFLLGFYSFLLVLIFILEIVAIVLIFIIYGPQIEEETKAVFKSSLADRYGIDANLTLVIDEFMSSHHCCGIYNGTDFKESAYIKGQGIQVPSSCCKDYNTTNVSTSCTKSPTDSNSYVNIGCFQKLKEEIMTESGKLVSIIVGIIIGILQLVGIFFACWIYREAKYAFS